MASVDTAIRIGDRGKSLSPLFISGFVITQIIDLGRNPKLLKTILLYVQAVDTVR